MSWTFLDIVQALQVEYKRCLGVLESPSWDQSEGSDPLVAWLHLWAWAGLCWRHKGVLTSSLGCSSWISRVLVESCCCSSTMGHPWRASGCRELGTPTPVCQLMWSVGKVFGNGWLGSQGLRLNVYISYCTPLLPLSYFSLHPFSLQTNPSVLRAQPGCLLTRCGVTHVWHHVLATRSCYSWSCTAPYGVVCSLNNHCSYS